METSVEKKIQIAFSIEMIIRNRMQNGPMKS